MSIGTFSKNDLTENEYRLFSGHTSIYVKNLLSLAKCSNKIDQYREAIRDEPQLSYRALIESQAPIYKVQQSKNKLLARFILTQLSKRSSSTVLILDKIWGAKQHLELYLRYRWITALYNFDYEREYEKITSSRTSEVDNIYTYLPISHIEGLDCLFNHANTFLAHNPNLKFIISNNRVISDDFWRLVSILARRKGVRTILLQHGGNYQTESSGTLVETEKVLADKWFGWSIDQKDSPVGIHNLIKVKKKSKIWYIPTTNWNVPAVDMPHPFMTSFDRHIEHQSKFLATCHEKVKRCLHVKLEPNDKGFDQNRFYSKYFENQKMYQHGNTTKLLQDTKLIIFGYSSTLMYNALAAEIPFILYWDKSLWPWNKKFDVLLTKLQKNRVFFDDGAALNAFLNENSYNIDDWWLSDQVQSVIAEFKQNFRWHNTYDEEIYALKSCIDSM